MKKYNRQRLFEGIRFSMDKTLTQRQVDSINAVLDFAEKKYPDVHNREMSYILATMFHESRFTPIRETFAHSSVQAISRLNRAYPRKVGTRRCYWCRHKNGKSYFGRGFVQLTWRRNYSKMGSVIGVNLVDHPDLALDPKVAAKVLVVGMVEGLFTGRKLKASDSYKTMRRVVNGTDKAARIARYADKMYRFIHKTTAVLPAPVIVPVHDNVPDKVTVHIGTNEFEFVPSQSTLSLADTAWDESGPVFDGIEIENTKEPEMNDTKSALASKTIWGAIIMIATTVLPTILTKLGYPDLANLISTGDYVGLAQFVAAALVVYGRDQAISKLRWPKVKF